MVTNSLEASGGGDAPVPDPLPPSLPGGDDHDGENPDAPGADEPKGEDPLLDDQEKSDMPDDSDEDRNEPSGEGEPADPDSPGDEGASPAVPSSRGRWLYGPSPRFDGGRLIGCPDCGSGGREGACCSSCAA